VKIYDLNSYKVVYSFKVESPVLAVGLSPDGKVLAAGTVGGKLHIRQRIPPSERTSASGPIQEKSTLEVLFPDLVALSSSSSSSSSTAGTIAESKKRKIRPNTRRYWSRGSNLKHALDSDDYQVQLAKKIARLKPYDSFLKKFLYKPALDSALENGDALVVLSVLEELLLRGGLRTALSGRQPQQLMPLINHILLNVNHPAHTDILITTTNQILDLYGGWFASASRSKSSVSSSSWLWWKDVLNKLKACVLEEAKVEKELLHLLGSIDTFKASYNYLNINRFGSGNDFQVDNALDDQKATEPLPKKLKNEMEET